MPEDAPYPNRLRELRLAAFLTRQQLADKTVVLAEEEPNSYSAVPVRRFERLERGEMRPRIRSAAAIAKALEMDPTEVFPLGPDDGIRNKEGKTTIPPNRRVRGKSPQGQNLEKDL